MFKLSVRVLLRIIFGLEELDVKSVMGGREERERERKNKEREQKRERAKEKRSIINY